MEFTQITQLIGSYGFPIICCLYMMKNNKETIKEMNKTLEANNNVVHENTLATKEAVTQLGTLVAQFNTFLSTLIQRGDIN